MGSNRFHADLPRYVAFCLGGRLFLDKKISKRIALEHINQALEDM